MNNVFLLLGPETGDKERFLDEVRANIEKRTGAPPEETSFYSFDSPVADVLTVLRNGSLFSAHRLVLLKGADEITKKAEVGLLVDYLNHPVAEATFCMLSDSPSIDKRIEKAAPSGAKKIFWELFENQKRSWILKFFRERRLSITPAATELLLDLVQNNTREMQRECERLCSFLGEGAEIDEGEIETYIYHSKEENVFTLFDHLVAEDLTGSIETVQSILLSGEGNGVSLLAGLLWQFRRLHEIKLLIDGNYSPVEACRKSKVTSKRGQRTYTTGSNNYTARELEQIIALIARYDAMVRGMRSDSQRLLMELFLYACIVRRGQETEPYRS